MQHIISPFGFGDPGDQDYPWAAAFGSNPALWVADYQEYLASDSHSSGTPSDWHGYLCADVQDNSGNWFEDCAETWRSDNYIVPPYYAHSTATSCFPIVWTDLGYDPTTRYMTPIAHGEVLGGVFGRNQYGFAISGAQLAQAAADINSSAGCNHHFSTDPTTYHLDMLEMGAEGSGTASGGDPSAELVFDQSAGIAATVY